MTTKEIAVKSIGELADSATIEGGVRTGEGARANAASFPGEREALATFEAPPLPALTLAAWVKVTGMGRGDKPYPRIIEWPDIWISGDTYLGTPSILFGARIAACVARGETCHE